MDECGSWANRIWANQSGRSRGGRRGRWNDVGVGRRWASREFVADRAARARVSRSTERGPRHPPCAAHMGWCLRDFLPGKHGTNGLGMRIPLSLYGALQPWSSWSGEGRAGGWNPRSSLYVSSAHRSASSNFGGRGLGIHLYIGGLGRRGCRGVRSWASRIHTCGARG